MSQDFHGPDGRRLSYRDTGGDGPVVLCLAGLTRNARDFSDLAAHLADRFRVIRLDSRGRGLSEWAEAPLTEYTAPVEARDARALLDHLDIARATVIGTSRGGILGMLLTVMAPGRLSALVLNDIGPVIEANGLAGIMDYIGIQPKAASFNAAARGLEASMSAAFPGVDPSQWLAFARALYNDQDGRPRLSYDPRLRDAVGASLASTPADLWGLFEADPALPVLAIRAQNSDLLSAATLAEMARRKPAMAHVTVQDRGHVPFLNEPEALTAIDTFLENHAK